MVVFFWSFVSAILAYFSPPVFEFVFDFIVLLPHLLYPEKEINFFFL